MVQETNIEADRTITIKTGPVLKGSLFVSLLFHLILLIALQRALPISWIKEPLRIYHVEMIRLPVDNLDKDGAGNELSKTNSKETPNEDMEDTISLDTKDKRYTSYARIIKTRLMQNWKYPKEAWENLIEGEITVLFCLDRQGELKDINILQSSHHNILDNETMRTIRTSAPFPSFPGSVTVKKLNISANFSYRLGAKR
jgi:TonB family protein